MAITWDAGNFALVVLLPNKYYQPKLYKIIERTKNSSSNNNNNIKKNKPASRFGTIGTLSLSFASLLSFTLSMHFFFFFWYFVTVLWNNILCLKSVFLVLCDNIEFAFEVFILLFWNLIRTKKKKQLSIKLWTYKNARNDTVQMKKSQTFFIYINDLSAHLCHLAGVAFKIRKRKSKWNRKIIS